MTRKQVFFSLLRPVAPGLDGRMFSLERIAMKRKTTRKSERRSKGEQPQPFTPGLSRVEVREHAYQLFRDRLPDKPLTLEDWVLAEKDLVNTMQSEQAE